MNQHDVFAVIERPLSSDAIAAQVDDPGAGGIVIFSGSLYALVLTGTSSLGAITPIGGLAFLAGWACLLIAAL